MLCDRTPPGQRGAAWRVAPTRGRIRNRVAARLAAVRAFRVPRVPRVPRPSRPCCACCGVAWGHRLARLARARQAEACTPNCSGFGVSHSACMPPAARVSSAHVYAGSGTRRIQWARTTLPGLTTRAPLAYRATTMRRCAPTAAMTCAATALSVAASAAMSSTGRPSSPAASSGPTAAGSAACGRTLRRCAPQHGVSHPPPIGVERVGRRRWQILRHHFIQSIGIPPVVRTIELTRQRDRGGAPVGEVSEVPLEESRKVGGEAVEPSRVAGDGRLRFRATEQGPQPAQGSPARLKRPTRGAAGGVAGWRRSVVDFYVTR